MFYSDLAQKNPAVLTEIYIPLWVHSSGIVGITNYTTAGSIFIRKGSITPINAGSEIVLHSLSSSWKSNQQFSLEASISANAGSAGYIALWDLSLNAIVGSSQLSTTVSTMTLFRSSKFTLVPGHIYGIAGWNPSGNGYYIYLSKAHLVAFMS